MPPKPMFLRMTRKIVQYFEAATTYAIHGIGFAADTRYTNVAVVERSVGGSEVTSIKYLVHSYALSGGTITTSAWSTATLPAGQWKTLGVDMTSRFEVATGDYVFVRFAVASEDEGSIVISPDGWPVINGGTSWNSYAVSPALKFLASRGEYALSGGFEILALSPSVVRGRTTPGFDYSDHLQTWDTRGSIALDRLINIGSFWYAIKGNSLYVSYDAGATWSGGVNGQTVSLDTNDNWTDIATTDSSMCFASGDGTNKLAITGNGGITWGVPTLPGGWNPTSPHIAQRQEQTHSSSTYHEATDEGGESVVVIDQTPGASQILYNRDPTVYGANPWNSTYAWQLITVPVPSASNIWSTVIHVAHQPASGNILFDYFLIIGSEGLLVSRDGGKNWHAKTYSDNPLS